MIIKLYPVISLIFILLIDAASGFSQNGDRYFIIKITDQQTGRGVPMVEVKTPSHRLYITDSKGIIAFDDAGLMNQMVQFSLFSHGYECPSAVIYINVQQGKSTEIAIRRKNIAERLYRITGQDIYGESALAGIPFPIRNQGLNGKVMGQDTFIETLYKGKLYWFWGDTFGPASFNGGASGATSELPSKGGPDPDAGIDLQYFVDSNGLNKSMCAIPGPGLKWIDWLAVLPDERGEDRLFAKYSVAKTLDIAYERGIARFNDSLQVFEPLVKIDQWLDKVHSSGHPARVRSDSIEYLYIFDRYGLERVRADISHVINPNNYEHFTCLKQGSKPDKYVVDRDLSGKIIYSWKTGSEAINRELQNRLFASGVISKDEVWFRPLDVMSGVEIIIGPSSVFWNSFRKRWIMLAQEYFGGVWFLEGDTPTGPWVYARKIVGHDNYDFYNIGQHPLFDQDNGRLIYFEGTYTTGFSGAKTHTPLYDYNQMMYRLALNDPRLSLPAPVYLVKSKSGNERYMMREGIDSCGLWKEIQNIPFFALPVSYNREDVIPIYTDIVDGASVLTASKPDSMKGSPLFYALPVVPKPVSYKDPISGMWKGIARMQDGTESDFELTLKLDGERISGEEISDGVFKNDTIALTLDIFGSYELTGKLVHGILSGNFRKSDLSEHGTWKLRRIEIPQNTTTSISIVSLYEYRKYGSKYRFYSVNPNLSTLSWSRSENPLCRVWKNPTSLLPLDYKAKPE